MRIPIHTSRSLIPSKPFPCPQTLLSPSFTYPPAYPSFRGTKRLPRTPMGFLRHWEYIQQNVLSNKEHTLPLPKSSVRAMCLVQGMRSNTGGWLTSARVLLKSGPNNVGAGSCPGPPAMTQACHLNTPSPLKMWKQTQGR
jgi:hypothetical protein